VQGGSTITQQVAKNVFLTPERSLSRKLQELLLAFWLEGRFTKKEIMAIYLNRVYLGSGAFGVDAAAHRYFSKSATELNLYESALMAGLLKAPSRYSPAASVERARDRVHQVLVNMEDAGYIREKDIAPTMDSYTKSPAHTAEGGDVRYFTDWIIDQVPNYIGQADQDLIVTTTMSGLLQTQAADALQTIVSTEGPPKRVSQGAIVAMTPDGAVKAMVGGLSYAKSQYNRAAQAKRQPGSVFKLFVYLAALEAGMTPLSVVEDAPISIQVGNKLWEPENSHRTFKGEVPLVQALRESLNTVSVRISQYAGIERVANMAMRLGIPDVPPHPSIALGAVEATLVEMTGAYAHLANHGNKVEPYGIVRIRTNTGEELYKREEKPAEQVLSNGTVEMMNYMLVDGVNRGTGFKARLKDRSAGGKTGTSQEFKDAWFIGFTPQLVAGVWVGNDDNKSMAKVMGGTIPAAVWHAFMTKAMEGQKALPIPTSTTSSDGLLPWLFGGASNNTDGDSQPMTDAPIVIPQDSPFGLAHPEPAAEQAPAPVVENASPSAASAAPTAPAPFTPPSPVMAQPTANTQQPAATVNAPATPFDMLMKKPIEQAPTSP
jgi:penicillin-binding protein 1A